MLIDHPHRRLRAQAAAGNAEALATLIAEHGRRLRIDLAVCVESSAAVERLETATWVQARPRLGEVDDVDALLRETARALALAHLEEADRRAVDARDVITRLVVQVALDDLRSSSSLQPVAEQVRQRFAGLAAEARDLLERRYVHGLSLEELARQRGMSAVELSGELAQARAACDWRAVAAAPVGDRLLPSLTEDLLAGGIDQESRNLLSVSVTQDLGRSARLERQVRLHLLLAALLGPFGESEVQSITAGALGQRPPVRHAASALASARTRVSDHPRSAASNRRPLAGHPRPAMPSVAVLGGAAVIAVVVVVLLLPGRPTPRPPERPPEAVVQTATNVPATATPATPPALGASPLRPQQLPAPAAVEQVRPPAPSHPPPAAVAAQPPAPRQERVTLINADTDQPIAGFETLAAEVTIRLADLPTRNLNFEFHAPDEVRSLVYRLPGCTLKADGIEKGRPFSLLNTGPDFKAWKAAPGDYTLTLKACSDDLGKRVIRTSTWRIRFE